MCPELSRYTPEPAVWFPTIRAGTGADVFTARLCEALSSRGIRAEIAWLPHRAEYLPRSVGSPEPPSWVNIVHANTWLHERFLPSRLPLVLTMHLCVHDPALSPYKSYAQALYHRLWIKRLERISLRRASRIIAVSRYTRDSASRAFHITDIDDIPNGVPIPDDLDGRLEHGPRDPFRLLYVGNWSARKGVDLLGPIMEGLGKGFELQYTADAHGGHRGARLPPNCRCIGRLDESALARAYREADALLFCSRLEGLPLTVIEAMASGLPAIASAAASMPEVVEDGVNGILCRPDDVQSFVNAARRMAADPQMLASMRVAARQRIRDHYDLSAMVESYLAVYRAVLDE